MRPVPSAAWPERGRVESSATVSTAKFVEVHVGDTVRLRKAHPCGGFDWSVVRVGADIGLRCLVCGHRVLLARSVFERRLKAFVARATPSDPTRDAG